MLATTTETWAAIGSCATVALLLIVPAVAVAWIVVERCIADSTSYERAINDVQQFINLTETSRAQLRSAPLLPLFDVTDAEAASEAIGRALTFKDAARKALWPALARSSRSRGSNCLVGRPAKAHPRSVV